MATFHFNHPQMKRINHLVLSIVLLVSQTFNLQASGKANLLSKVSHVVVYNGQAQVTRTAIVNCKSGSNTLRFGGISPYINAGTIQVKTESGFNISSVNVQSINEEPFLTDEISDLKDSVERLDDMINSLKSKRDGLQAEKDVMLANKQITGSTQILHADDLEETMALYRKRFAEINDELYKIAKSEKPLLEIRTKFNARIQEYLNTFLNKTELVVLIDAPEAKQDVNIEFTYTVTNCNWFPYYDIRIKDTKSPLVLVGHAGISQETGENWNDVSMVLSTANPSDRSSKQELQTNRIDFFQPIQPNYRGARVESAPAMMKSGAVEDANSIVMQEQTHIEFVIKNKTTIISGQSNQHVELISYEIPAVYAYATVPKLDAAVFATALISSENLAAQLPGEAHIYFDGTYTGDTYLSGSTEDSILVSLGKDTRIPVKRELVKEHSGKSCFGNTKTDQRNWKIEVRNTRKEPIELIIEDQIPVSSNSEIEVKLTQQGNAQFDAETGKLTWRLKLAAEQTQTVEFGFEVKYPKNKQITPF